MTVAELLEAQLTDVFRAGLVLALIYTTARTQAVTGRLLPLLAGIMFVAIIVPVTAPNALPAPLWMQIATGLFANALFVALGLAIWKAWERLGSSSR